MEVMNGFEGNKFETNVTNTSNKENIHNIYKIEKIKKTDETNADAVVNTSNCKSYETEIQKKKNIDEKRHANIDKVTLSSNENKNIGRTKGDKNIDAYINKDNLKEKIEDITSEKPINNNGDVIEHLCLICSKGGGLISCGKCERFYHEFCLSENETPTTNNKECWVCPKCKEIIIPVTSNKRRKKLRILRNDLKNNPKKETVSKVKVKQKSEGSKFNSKINVGEKYQVPFVTTFFLNEYAGKYEESHKSELVYSPYVLERVKEQLKREGKLDLGIKDDLELINVIEEISKKWKYKFGCHPFTVEYAFKILHRANYNRVKALELLESADFNFLEICDPPVRRYENKWRPGDKRGKISDSPYPSIDLMNHYVEQMLRLKSDKEKNHNPSTNS